MTLRIAFLVVAGLVEALTTPGIASAADLVAVPEPATIFLVGAGAGVAGATAWWNRRRRR